MATMQGVEQRRYSDDILHLDLSTATTTTTTTTTSSLSIDEEESTADRIHRLISEHPVIIFSRSSCCMCHVIKNLLSSLGVHPTIIQLDDHEISALPSSSAAPAVFIAGASVGGLESLVALHLSSRLVPMLVQAGVLWL